MSFRPAFYAMVKRDLGKQFSFSLKTITFFLTPLIWLVLFLFLRGDKVTVSLPYGLIPYTAFIVLGIAVWRMVGFLFNKTTRFSQINRDTIKPILSLNYGKKTLFWSLITTNLISVLLLGLFVVSVGMLLYGFTIYLNNLPLAIIVLFLTLFSNLGIALILLSFSFDYRWIKDFSYILVTVFVLTSGVFFPAEYFPFPLNLVAFAFPLTQGVSLLHSLLLFENAPFSVPIFITLLIETIVLFFLGKFLFFRKVSKLFR
jgi:ABC-type polysaccharide/polyol phosphate export permease